MKTIGLYIHIPFCIKKCHYCDFNSFTTLELIPEYLAALKKEILSLQKCEYTAQTIFIGGGTPTILRCEHLADILRALYESIFIAKDAEITIEANPGTLTREKLISLKNLGVNRLSIGLQAYQNQLLKIMGRIHTVEDFEKNFETARNVGFDNINIDLIFGLPNQEVEDFDETLKKVLHIFPEHISCYSLSVEEDTEFYRRQQEGTLALPSEDDEREMYYRAIELLTNKGYNHYEISNFAMPGRESKHNMIYWTYQEYLGLGAGAHSFLDNKRFYNYSSIQAYIKSINEHSNAVANIEPISVEEQQAEFCFLGLRLLDGLDKKAFQKRFGKKFTQVYGRAIEKLKEQELIKENTNKIRLTSRGLDFANIVFAEFLP